MDAAAWRRALFTFFGLALGAGLVGLVALGQGWLGPRSLVAYLFAIPFVAATLAGHHYRHHGEARAAVALGMASGFAAQSALFGFPVLAAGLQVGFAEIDLAAVVIVLVAIPLAMSAVAGLGAAILVRGVARYRARHGLVHAPQ